MSAAETSSEQALRAENEALRTRIEQLESELVEVQSRTNAAVGYWQERAYWLERLHLDLNALMRRPGADQVRVTLKAVRAVYWRLKRLKRRFSGQ